jgi:cobalamin biosynthesis protein CobT
MNWLTLLAPLSKLWVPKSSPEEEDLWATVSLKLEMNKMLKRLFKPWTRKTSMADRSMSRLLDPEKKVKNNNKVNNKKEEEELQEEEEEEEEEPEALLVVLSEEDSAEDSLKEKTKENNKKKDQEEEEDSEEEEEEAEVDSEEERPVLFNLDNLIPEPNPRLHCLLPTCHSLLMMPLLERSSLMLVLNSRLLTL